MLDLGVLGVKPTIKTVVWNWVEDGEHDCQSEGCRYLGMNLWNCGRMEQEPQEDSHVEIEVKATSVV